MTCRISTSDGFTVIIDSDNLHLKILGSNRSYELSGAAVSSFYCLICSGGRSITKTTFASLAILVGVNAPRAYEPAPVEPTDDALESTIANAGPIMWHFQRRNSEFFRWCRSASIDRKKARDIKGGDIRIWPVGK